MVLRTCLIGEELMTKRHLLEWFRNSEGTVNGFTNWWCTPITSMEFGRVCLRLLEKGILSPGIMNLATERVSKYTMLKTYNEKKGLNKILLPVEAEHAVDKSLISIYSSITKAIEIPSFEQMIEDLVSFKGNQDDFSPNSNVE
jgi:dTDP-4-dehydrorhamnose reductase